MANPFDGMEDKNPFDGMEVKEKAKPVVTLGPEGFKQSVKEAIAGDVFPTGAAFVSGLGTALDNAALRLKQLTAGLTPQDQNKLLANRAITETIPGAIGNIAGNISMVGSPAAAAEAGLGGLITRAAPGVVGRTVAPTVAAGAVGAGLGAVEPTLPEESTVRNMAYGAAGAGIGNAAIRGVGRAFSPMRPSSDVKQLLSQNIVPTPGQAAGSTSFLGKLEQKIQSIPLVGDIITSGRNRAIKEFNVAALKKALPPGTNVDDIGRVGLDKVDDVLSDAYSTVLSKITVKPDASFAQSVLQTIPDNYVGQITDSQKTQLLELVQKRILDRFAQSGTTVPGELAKQIDSELGAIARTFRTSSDAAQRQYGNAVRDVQSSLRALIKRSAPAQSIELDSLNKLYGNFLRVERAASMVGADDGKFTPAQLHAAVRALDSSRNKKAFASGKAVMQDLTDPAHGLLTSRSPNSLTADRALWALLLGGAGAGFNAFYGGPGFITALGLSPLMYSRLGSKYLIGGFPWQQALTGVLQSASPAVTQAGARAGVLEGQQGILSRQ